MLFAFRSFAARDRGPISASLHGTLSPPLSSLDALRTLYNARRSLAATRLTEAANRVELYRALGGDATTTGIARPANIKWIEVEPTA